MGDIKDLAQSVRCFFVDIGVAPVGTNNVKNAISRIESLGVDTEHTVVYVSITGNSLVRDKCGGVNFQDFHHHNGAVQCSVSDVAELITLQIDMVGRLIDLGYKVVSMAPLPRYFGPCCTDMNHFGADFCPVALNELIRDGGTYLSRRVNTMWSETPRRVVGVHPERFFSDSVYVAGAVIWRDHVHLKNQSRVKMVRALLVLANRLVTGSPVTDWYDHTSIPDDISFGEWLGHYREHNAGKLPAIVCAGAVPACGPSGGQTSRRGSFPKHRHHAPRGRGRGGRGNYSKKAKQN